MTALKVIYVGGGRHVNRDDDAENGNNCAFGGFAIVTVVIAKTKQSERCSIN